MNKSILVIDTPKNCYECPLMNEDMYCKGFVPYYAKDGTPITKMCVEYYVLYGTKHPSCPLTPLLINNPDYRQAFEDGWQCCLDELGEE